MPTELELLRAAYEENPDEYHLAYYGALGAALGYEHSDSGLWLDDAGFATNVAMLEARLAARG